MSCQNLLDGLIGRKIIPVFPALGLNYGFFQFNSKS